MKPGTSDLIKFKRLKRRLGITKNRDLIGLLETLWGFTQRQAPRGDIGRFDDEDIADELEWDGEAGDLIEALVACGWLDKHPVHRLVVHDWPDHAPNWVHALIARTKQGWARCDQRSYIAVPSETGVLPNSVPHLEANSVPHLEANSVPHLEANSYPILTNPILTNPKPEDISHGSEAEPRNHDLSAVAGPRRKKSRDCASTEPRYSAEFESWWKRYPHRDAPVGKALAWTEWIKLSSSDHSLVAKATDNFRLTKRAKEGFAKDPCRFLKHQEWRDLVELSEAELVAASPDERIRAERIRENSFEEFRRKFGKTHIARGDDDRNGNV